ncbi:Uncharacterised protein [Chlamydia trachomatis]|nr:Uncharacterised protein [Chlamydia trachomatis]
MLCVCVCVCACVSKLYIFLGLSSLLFINILFPTYLPTFLPFLTRSFLILVKLNFYIQNTAYKDRPE